VFPKVGREEVD